MNTLHIAQRMKEIFDHADSMAKVVANGDLKQAMAHAGAYAKARLKLDADMKRANAEAKRG